MSNGDVCIVRVRERQTIEADASGHDSSQHLLPSRDPDKGDERAGPGVLGMAALAGPGLVSVGLRAPDS